MRIRLLDRLRLATLALVLALPAGGLAAGCTIGCPAALLEGVLERRGDDLVVIMRDVGIVEPVDWGHSHHGVRERDGELVVVDWLGIIRAREGDFVHLGGGEVETGTWGICGSFEVREPPP